MPLSEIAWHTRPSRHKRHDPRSYSQSPPATPAPLTIRNLTAIPIKVVRIDRITSTSSTNSSHWAHVFGVSSQGPQGQNAISEDVLVQLPAFDSTVTSIQPSSSIETIRLTFDIQGNIFQLYTPCPSEQSTTLTPLSPDSKDEFTAVYLPATSYLAVFSSTKLNSWMSKLKDVTPISSLSIPGTHNSPTCYSALPTVRCQDVSVREQLDNGIRFLDIRVAPVDAQDASKEELQLVHAVFSVSWMGYKYLRNLIGDVEVFLRDNPSETVIISLKREGLSKASDQHVSRILHRHYANDPALWFTAPRIPALGEVRGKIVLLRRLHLDDSLKDEYGGLGWGIDGSDWPDNCEDGLCGSKDIRVQDYYDLNETSQITKKIKYIEAHLARAASCVATLPEDANAAPHEAAKHPIFINFLTGSNLFRTGCWPDRVAAKVNPHMIEFLCRKHNNPEFCGEIGDGSTGVVVCDWVGRNGDWDLVRCVIGHNARLELKEKRMDGARG